MMKKHTENLTSGNVPGVPLLDVLQQTSRLLKNNVDHTDDDDDHDRNEENGDYGDDGGGDLFAPGHQEGSSTSLPFPWPMYVFFSSPVKLFTIVKIVGATM